MQEDEILFTEFFNQKLKERGLTLKNLSEATGIAVKHLENFSHGRFERLPSAPYVHGYFTRLGPILGFEPDEWWNRIKAEDAVARSGSADRMPKNRYSKLRGRALFWGAIALVLVGLYIGARYTTIIGQPGIVITAPEAQAVDQSTTVWQSILTLEGFVANADTFMLNGETVTLGEGGAFRVEVLLRPGLNTIELRAKKFLGREDILTREVYYDDSQIIAPAPDDFN
ncbi:MAG: hypothetical protein A2855_01140 [Candidatus Liptonbacteria bacterium RIFCSPHIGHO2_01_FULL_57_28]|uniref:HTH cro/C1-type domain-containing protein n=1 Tax=Candidatus Liptonbacteria bacterium RIFCSPHIGHO2_01_FULL_57_28 TaxID=1798647 RepID=A0A1G2CCH8_9BACT|nr:MAG: hypothetical protein A2855_01140 [Candidatus Liptonbacteria bacterium RIFCSPHIGHO2_01_FULL_57_28]